jgi:pyruvate/oxaloacetate carboxyltransferase/biotin carboxyl carrier protein
MDKIHFVDQTIRLAQQGLWGFMMRTDHIEPIAEVMDRVGYKTIGTVGGNGYVVEVRNLNEDPWERVRILSKLIKRTPLRGSYHIWGLADFDQTTPRDIISLWIKRSIANGIKSFWICDYQADMEKFVYFARIAKAEGAEVAVALVYASSPVHDNKHWARKTRLIAEAKDCVDAIVIGDPGGVLRPENTKEFIKTVQQNCDGIPIELQIQCSSGLAPYAYLEAIKAGVRTVQTAVAPLANGTSMPSTENILKNVKRLGFTSDIDEDALAAESEHFRKIAEREGLPIGVPPEYDLYYFEHQVPGGMMTNLTRQLREVRMEHRLDEILEEVVRVRKDFGYPVMATPYSQIVGAQAADNVISGERYKQLTDSTIKYVLGYYGEPLGPIDQNLRDKVMSSPRTKQFVNRQSDTYLKSVETIRKEVGPDLSDDELLLKLLIPGQSIKRGESKKGDKSGIAKPSTPVSTHRDFPTKFTVEVDGEVFDVKILTTGNGSDPVVEGGTSGSPSKKRPSEMPPGGVISGMAGLVLSFEVGVGDKVNAGDVVAIIEAMKMRRHLTCPHGGIVKDICAREGEIVQPEDLIMVVE